VLIAGYVHDNEDFLHDSAWDEFPFVIQLWARMPRNGLVIHAFMAPFISAMFAQLEAWYKCDTHTHIALELWGQLDFQSTQVGRRAARAINVCACCLVDVPHVQSTLLSHVQSTCLRFHVCVQVRIDKRTWRFVGRDDSTPPRSVPFAAFCLAHYINTYFVDPTPWRQAVLSKVGLAETGKPVGKHKQKTSAATGKEAAVIVDPSNHEGASVLAVLELVQLRRRPPTSIPDGKHPLKTCTFNHAPCRVVVPFRRPCCIIVALYDRHVLQGGTLATSSRCTVAKFIILWSTGTGPLTWTEP
jgi:hypothetical protein